MTVGEEDVTVLCAEPRLLALRIAKKALRCLVFAGHCPHVGRQQERLAFLAKFQALLKGEQGADVIIGGLDANARPPPTYAQVTRDLEFGEPDPAGQVLVEALQRRFPASTRATRRPTRHPVAKNTASTLSLLAADGDRTMFVLGLGLISTPPM